jgi:HD superfamily phosphohydrolase YqeK
MTYEKFIESIIIKQGICLSEMSLSKKIIFFANADKLWVKKKDKTNPTLKITEQNLKALILYEVNKTIQLIENSKNV